MKNHVAATQAAEGWEFAPFAQNCKEHRRSIAKKHIVWHQICDVPLSSLRIPPQHVVGGGGCRVVRGGVQRAARRAAPRAGPWSSGVGAGGRAHSRRGDQQC